MTTVLTSDGANNSTPIASPEQFSPEEIQLFQGYMVDYDHKEKPEECIFSWCGRKFIQRYKMNYITAIGASKVAAGKSMLCHLMMATSLCGEVYDQSEPEHKLQCLVKNCSSLYIDAEMGRSSTYTALIRIKQTCAIYGNPVPYRYKQRTRAASLDAADADKLVRALNYYIVTFKPDVIYIDNMVFILNNMDVNDPTSAKRIAEIDALCRQHHVTIVLVAHGNKSADDVNLAGSAGTMTMRLSAYGLAIEEGEESQPGKFKHVITQKARQGGFDGLPDLTFHFLPFISGPYESVYPVLGEPLRQPTEDEVSRFTKMFEGRETMSRMEMVKCITDGEGVKDRQAHNIINDAVKTAVIMKVGDGKRDPYKLLRKSEMCNE